VSVYVTANLTITDPSWVETYIPAVHDLVAKHGGRYIAQSTEVTVVEGDGPAPSVSVIVEFPDRAAAEAWYNDDAYKPWLEARQARSTGTALMFDGG
jgi:uncharacterized protein (DUF1330 family)